MRRSVGRLRPVNVGPAVKQLQRQQERPENMKEVTIWIDDDSTGNKIQVENGNVKSLEHAFHLMRSAWDSMDRVNENPESEGNQDGNPEANPE